MKFENIASFRYCNWPFIYAIACDTGLGKVPEIAVQKEARFCDRHRLKASLCNPSADADTLLTAL